VFIIILFLTVVKRSKPGVRNLFAVAGRITYFCDYDAGEFKRFIVCIASVLLPHTAYLAFTRLFDRLFT